MADFARLMFHTAYSAKFSGQKYDASANEANYERKRIEIAPQLELKWLGSVRNK